MPIRLTLATCRAAMMTTLSVASQALPQKTASELRSFLPKKMRPQRKENTLKCLSTVQVVYPALDPETLAEVSTIQSRRFLIKIEAKLPIGCHWLKIPSKAH